jgi:CBS domain-containing protein
MQAAPLWDPVLCQFVGLLTVTDFIDILRHYRKTKSDVSTLNTRSIAEILNDPIISNTVLVKSAVGGRNRGFLSADTSTSLKQACKLLHQHSLDFLPVIFPEDMRVLATVTYTNILEHLVTHFREQRRLFDDTIYDLGIGTYHDKLVTITPVHTLADALELLHEHGLSALPVVHPETSKIMGVYSRSDITFLANASDAEDAIANLDLTLETVLHQQRSDVTTPDALHTCTKLHTLQSIFEYFAQLRFNRLFVVDDNDCVVGVVSARDLVAYFLGAE